MDVLSQVDCFERGYISAISCARISRICRSHRENFTFMSDSAVPPLLPTPITPHVITVAHGTSLLLLVLCFSLRSDWFVMIVFKRDFSCRFISSSSSSELNDCSKLTSVLKSGSRGNGTCSIYEPESCDIGDLSGKLENISIGIANINKKRFRVIDLNLPLSKVIGHALVIRDLSGEPVTCANILKSGPLYLSASFAPGQHDGVSGFVSFKQDSPYHPTVIHYKLDGLSKRANGNHIHKFPIPQPPPKNPCAGSVVSGHLNPYGIVKDSQYPVDGSNSKTFLRSFYIMFVT